MNRSKIFGALAGVAALASFTTTPFPSAHAATVDDFDDIQNWTGSGANESALVIQWNINDGVTTTPYSYAWGYRWDDSAGNPSGWDMLVAISGADPWLELVPLTDYSGFESYTGAAFGIFYTPDGQASLNSPGAPGDTPGTTSGTGGLYQSGWFSAGYWGYDIFGGDFEYDSFPPGSGTSIYDVPGSSDYGDVAWGFSPVGAASRPLIDGSWDGWSFAPDFASATIVAPLAAVPEPSSAVLLIAAGALAAFFRRRMKLSF